MRPSNVHVARRLRRIAALLAACLACGAGEPERAVGPRPDVVLVSIDSLRADHLGCYGYPKPTSPRIDALAADGVRFANAVSTTSWTLPAHAALFTGLYDPAHGLVDNGLRLGEVHLTLAELLAAAGYQTAGFYGGPYLHPTFGLAQGFEHYASGAAGVGDASSPDEVRAQALLEVQPAHADVTGPRLREAVRRWLPLRDDRPSFAFLHLWDVHYDYIPPARYLALFDPDYAGSLDPTRLFTNPAIHAAMPERDRAHLIARYDGEIRFTDEILGEILELLARPDRSTLVVVTADHGEEFFEHGGKGHKRTLFDEVVRVPLVFHWPGRVQAGSVVETQVRLIDVMPTLAAAAGAQPPDYVQGRDLGPLLRGEPLDPQPALAELDLGPVRFHALRTNRSKIVSDPRNHYASYDLERDPGERRARRGEQVSAAAGALRDAVARSEALHRRLGAGAVEAHVPGRELTERLRDLGYLEEPP